MDILKDFLLQLSFIVALIFTFQIFLAGRFEQSKYITLMQCLLFGSAILLCMSFPTYITPEMRLDIRILPLLLGTLYGGWRTGLFLSALIILFRAYLGIDVGLFTTVTTLFMSIPIFIYFQKKVLGSYQK